VSTASKPGPRFHFRPDTENGWAALALLATSAILILASFLLNLAFGLSLDYVVGLVVVYAAGLAALFGIVVRHERSVGVILTLAVGALVAVIRVVGAA
jgi:hypothetical protein